MTIGYTDAYAGAVQSVTSSATSNVANVNDVGVAAISGTPTEDQVLTASLTDEDGTSNVTYQWKRDGSAISGATNQTYTLVQADVGKPITVTIGYTDAYAGAGQSVTSSATGNVANINDVGVAAITGTPTEDQVLTASLTEEDGTSNVTYQWKRDGVDISGVDQIPTAAQAGESLFHDLYDVGRLLAHGCG